MTDTKIDVQAPADAQSEALKSVRDELRTLMTRRRSLRTKLLLFQRRHRSMASRLPDLAKDESEEKKKSAVT